MNVKHDLASLKGLIENDESIKLINFQTFLGLNESQLNSLESRFSVKFDSEIRAFFSETNGFQMRWMHKSNADFNPSSDIYDSNPFEWLSPMDNYWKYDGVINILPLEMIFTEKWKNIIWFDGDKEHKIEFKGELISLLKFKKRMRPFDIFSKDQAAAFYLHGKHISNVILGQDGFIEFESSKLITFKRYLDFLILSKGDVERRRALFRE